MNENWEYEQAIIGGIYNNFEHAKTCCNLAIDEFTVQKHRQIYSHFINSDDADKFQEKVCQDGLAKTLIDCGVDSTLAFVGNLEFNIRQLRSRRQEKRIRQKLLEIAGNPDFKNIVMPALEQMIKTEKARMPDDVDPDIAKKQIAEVIRQYNDNDTTDRIFTGIPQIDENTAGLRMGTISVIGAKPSVGKTSFALCIALHALKLQKKVMFFTLEMSDVQIWERLIANSANLDYGLINKRCLGNPEYDKFKQTANNIADTKLFTVFSDAYNVEQMADKIMQVQPDLVVIDFLQYMQCRQKLGSKHLEIDYIMGQLKQLAKSKYNPCHICLLSQLNRSTGGNNTSAMFAMRESGSIEEKGDYIFVLNRPAVENDAEPQEKTIIRLTKNKFGQVNNNILLWFDGRYQRFRNLKKGEQFPLAVKGGEPW
jgi:replicative DNA helicase